MSGLFTRLKDSISADIHDLLDQKEDKNPMAVLNQYLRQSELEVEKVRKLVERQYRLKEEFTREYYQAIETAEKRKHQAEIAHKAGEASMELFASNEYEEYANRAARMKTARDDSAEQLEALEQKYEEMKRKLKDMRLKRMELMGKENMARAYSTVNRVLDDTSDKCSTRFSDMERYIDDLEHKVKSAYYRQTFDSKIANLENQMKEKEKTASNN
jgi:phage shock protein A